MRILENGSIVKHFKGHYYKIICIANCIETNEKMVIYQPLDDQKFYASLYKNFMDEIDKEKYPEITQKYKFEIL